MFTLVMTLIIHLLIMMVMLDDIARADDSFEGGNLDQLFLDSNSLAGLNLKWIQVGLKWIPTAAARQPGTASIGFELASSNLKLGPA